MIALLASVSGLAWLHASYFNAGVTSALVIGLAGIALRIPRQPLGSNADPVGVPIAALAALLTRAAPAERVTRGLGGAAEHRQLSARGEHCPQAMRNARRPAQRLREPGVAW